MGNNEKALLRAIESLDYAFFSLQKKKNSSLNKSKKSASFRSEKNLAFDAVVYTKKNQKY